MGELIDLQKEREKRNPYKTDPECHFYAGYGICNLASYAGFCGIASGERQSCMMHTKKSSQLPTEF